MRLRTKSALVGSTMLAATLFKFWVDESDDLAQPEPEAVRFLARCVGYVVEPTQNLVEDAIGPLLPSSVGSFGYAAILVLFLLLIFLLWAVAALVVGWIIRVVRQKVRA